MGPWDRLAASGTAALAVWAGAAACARQGAPPGGPADRIPPYVVSTEPDTFARVEAFDGRVRIEFNERISERASGGLNSAVEVSPRSGEVRVSHRRRGLDVRMEGGFLEGRVYRITLLPVISDMFGTQIPEPFEFFFSTGPDFNPNAVAGVMTDRITGAPVPNARVDAWREGEDSVIYTTVTDEEGIFALRTLPEGTYHLRTYVDVNRNFEANFVELQDSSDGWELGVADTVLVFRELLQPDTTPAQVLSADALDSMTLELGLDDHLEPDADLSGVSVTLARDSAEVAGGAPDQAPGVVRLLLPRAFEEHQQAVADSLARVAAEEARQAAAEAAGDSAAAPPPEPEPEEAAEPEQAAGPEQEPAPARPSQLFYALLDGPLEPEARYRVAVSGLVNLQGVPDGGGETRLVAPAAPEPPPELPADSAAAPADSAAAPPDTTGAAPAPPDTTTPPDTVGAAPGATRTSRPRPTLRRLRD